MRYLKQTTTILIILLLFSCSAQRQLSRRVTGEWQIVSYKEHNINESNVSMTNIGTINFGDNGEGTRSLNFSILGQKYMEGEKFKWTNTENVITIQSQEQEHPKSWIVTESSSKNQKWKSTDGQGNVQIMKLTKQD